MNQSLASYSDNLNYGSLSPYNSDTTDLFAETTRLYRGLETGVAVVLLGYLLLGLSGNLLTIIALLRCPRVRNVTAAFIISLCVADCLFCVLVLPWEVSRFFAGKWVWGQGVICTVLPLIRYWNVAVSLLSIAMITINRYIMIAHFGIYKNVYRKGWIALMIAFCWLFPFCILVPTLLGKWGRFGMIEALETCSIIDENGQSPKKVLFGLGFCVPALVIIICYSLIFYVIRKSENRMRNHSANSSNETKLTGVGLQPKLPGKVDKEARRKRNEWRITKMVMIIFLTFMVTYLPITLVKFFDPSADVRALHLLGYVLVYLSCCINPVIYVIMNRQYRQAYRIVLLCKRPKLHSFASHEDRGLENPALRYLSKSVDRLSLTYGLRMSATLHDKTECSNTNPVNNIGTINCQDEKADIKNIVKVSSSTAARLDGTDSDSCDSLSSENEDPVSSKKGQQPSQSPVSLKNELPSSTGRENAGFVGETGTSY